MSNSVSLHGVGTRSRDDGSRSRPAPARHRDPDLTVACAAAAGLERSAAREILTATLAALGGRLPRSTSCRLADHLPRDLARVVLTAAPTGARFGGLAEFVSEVGAASHLGDATARAGVLAIGRALERRLPLPILREVCFEVPGVARPLLPGAWPGISSQEQSILRTGRVAPLCTGPLPSVPMSFRYRPWQPTRSGLRLRPAV